MYEKEFQLKSRPFQAGSRAEFWCQTGNSGQAVAQICRTLSRGSGISVLIGGAGTGKTLALDIIARRFADRNPEIVHIACSRLDNRRDILQRILFELNLACRDMSDSDMRLTVVQHFRSICGQYGREVLLLVDEAHNLDVELIDELRIVVESASRNSGKCHLVLAGTSRLEDHLNHTNLDTFNQRISCRVYLTAMDRKETAGYVSQHMLQAGGGKREFFSPEALTELARVTGGIPRLVNQVCDQCLVVIANSGARTVDQNMVTDAWCDIQNLPRQTVAPVRLKENGVGTTATSSIEFGSLDDGPVGDSFKSAASITQVTEETVDRMSLAGETDRNHSAFEHDFSADRPVEVARTKVGDPFGEKFSVEEAVQSQNPRRAGNAKQKAVVELTKQPVVAENQIAKRSQVDVQMDASTLAEFPAYDPNFENEQSSGYLDTGVSTNPICEDPATEESDTLPIQSLTAAIGQANRGDRVVDDRDMLVSADRTIFEPTDTAPVEDAESDKGRPTSPAALKGPHKPGAVRMEYRQLFAQLRSETP